MEGRNVTRWQWLLFLLSKRWEYGPTLWGWFGELVEAIKRHDRIDAQQGYAMFRAPAKRRWIDVRGSLPNECQLRAAYVCALQRHNGRGWIPPVEDLRVAGLRKYYV